jgi:hypothetical protein
MPTINFKGYDIVIEPDGKPLREDLNPMELAQGQTVKLTILKDGNAVAVADRFGYRAGNVNYPALATPFTNMQRFIFSHENPIKEVK